VQTADLFMLDSMCDLTYFENVQEHLLSLIPISQFKTEWILENEEFRKKCISKFPIEDVREEWFLDDEKEIFKKRVKDEKKIKNHVREINRNRRGTDRISRETVNDNAVLGRREIIPCECGSERWEEFHSRHFCMSCGLEDLKNDHQQNSPLYQSEIPTSTTPPQVSTPPSKENTRLKSFLYFVRNWRGQGGHKGNAEEMKILSDAFPDPSELSYSKLKLWMYREKGLNHLYAGIYALLEELGRPRPNVDAVYDNIIEEFHAGQYGEPPKSKLKNLEILHLILDKIGFVYERDDEASLAKGRHFF
jgi:hypothetical protein